MSSPDPSQARLSDVADALSTAGYEIIPYDLAGLEAVIGETRYALVACFELDGWEGLDETVFDVQAALTRVAEEAPSARAWDLYLVVLVIAEVAESASRAVADAIEADTRYARKFVRYGVTHATLDRALRPLLPLREPASLELTDPLAELRAELRALDVDDDVADLAVESFADTNVVEVR